MGIWATVVAIAVVGGCSVGSGGATGSRTPSAEGGSGAAIIQSAGQAPSGPTWRDSGVTFTLPEGWSIVAGDRLSADSAGLSGLAAVSDRLGFQPEDFAVTLSSYDQVAFGPDAGLVIVTTTPQADQDAMTETAVRDYLHAVCSRQPTMCEELVSFEERQSAQGAVVVYLTRGQTGYLSANLLLPYVARAGASSTTRQGRRVSVEASTTATVAACVDAIVATVHQT